MNICIVEDCDSKSAARKLCNKHYQHHYQAGTLDVISPNTTRHNLSNVDREARTAVCALCGPTIIVSSGPKQVKCKATKHSRVVRYGKDHQALKHSHIVSEYRRLIELQNNLCAICDRPERNGRSLALDHCHETGKIRGLLCFDCNTGVGKFQDSPETLLAAANYLQKA